MAARKAKSTEVNTVEIPALKRVSVKLRIIGTTPLFQHRLSNKADGDLLIGGQKKTAADKKANIKHHPLAEYHEAAELLSSGPTALGLRMVALKAAMIEAAIETPGVTGMTVKRMLFLPGDHAPLYGVPQLRIDTVRNSDPGRTPDKRTRPFLPKWGAEIEFRYVTPNLSLTGVATLLANAGVIIGIGDYRQGKGAGSYGCFRVIGADEDDPEWDDLVANHGREAQLEALEDPEYADEETARLMEQYLNEVRRRAA